MIREDFKKLDAEAFTVDIDISLVGIRNLVKYARRPTVIIRLTNDPEKRELKLKLEELKTCNPQIGQNIRLDKVKLPFEPLLWPHL